VGGPCYYYEKGLSGRHTERRCPQCTDNFQIVWDGFEFEGMRFYSVEQAFQSLKFPIGSIAQVEILNTLPKPTESDFQYSMRTYHLGQRRLDTSRRDDWERVKVKVMTLLNCAKYASSADMCSDLLDLGRSRILGQQSTWNWTYWNAAIQTLIRDELIKGTKPDDLMHIIDMMEPQEVEALLGENYDFKASSEHFRHWATGTFELAEVTHMFDPPPKVKPEESQNYPIYIFGGRLIMADVSDFQSTFEQFLPDTVVTMCSKPPSFPDTVYEGKWMHRDFNGHDLHNMEVMGTIVNETILELQQGKTVLIHCLHGQDRTGIIGAALTIAGREECQTESRLRRYMIGARPKKHKYWYGEYGVMHKNGYHRTAWLLALHASVVRNNRTD
jgi:predicted NAD-dependent protein-ADP-ribosyltransferase YbiA (DUF1768 family)